MKGSKFTYKCLLLHTSIDIDNDLNKSFALPAPLSVFARSLLVSIIKTLEKPIVYIVDSDHNLLHSLSTLLTINDVIVEGFDCAEDFLNTRLKSRAACLIVEVNLPKMDGIELLKHINNLGVRLPTIVVSSGSGVSDAVRAMQANAIDFIEKPYIENTLFERVLSVIKKTRVSGASF